MAFRINAHALQGNEEHAYKVISLHIRFTSWVLHLPVEKIVILSM